MSKRFLSLVLALVMVLGTLGTAVFAAGPTGNERVDRLIELGLVKGRDGDYALAESIRRDEVAAMVVRAMELETVAEAMKYTPTKFKDVKAGEWNNGYVAVAEGEGITKGVSANEFAPARDITYAEVAAMMVRVLGAMTAEEEKTASWPATYIAKAEKLGIFKDVEMTATNAVAKRQQVFEMVFNTISNKAANYLVANTVEGIVVENYRTETLNKDEIIVHVMNAPEEKSGGKYDAGKEFNVKINGELKAKGLDVETLLGKVVTVSFDKDGKVVDIKEVAGYNYVSGRIADITDQRVQIGTTWYTVVKDEARASYDERLYQAYYNNEDFNYVLTGAKNDFVDMVKLGEYTRATVRNGKVLFIEAFNFDDIAPVAKDINSKDIVEYFDDSKDGAINKLEVSKDAYVIAFEDGEMKLGNYEDIKANDIIHWYEDYKEVYTVFVRPAEDNAVEGIYKDASAAKAKDAASIRIKVDDAEYLADIGTNNRNPVYSTLSSEQEYYTLTEDYDIELEQFEKQEVTVLRDMFGKVQLIGSDKVDGRFYAVVNNLYNYDFQLVKTDNSKDWYDTDRNTVLVGPSGTLEQKIDRFDRTDLVLVTSTEENLVTRMERMTGKEEVITKVKADVVDFGGGDYYYIGRRTAFFVVGGKSSAGKDLAIEAISANDFIKKYNQDEVMKGYVVVNSRDDRLADVVVITDATAKAGKVDLATLVAKVTRVRFTGGKYYLTVQDQYGEVTTHLVAEDVAEKFLTTRNLLVVKDSIVELTMVKNDDKDIVGMVELLDETNEPIFKVVREGRDYARNERYVELEDINGVVRKLWISRNAEVFGEYRVGSYMTVYLGENEDYAVDAYETAFLVDVRGTKTTGEWATPVDPDQEAADAVIALIDALPAVADLTEEDKEAVEAARAAYDELTAEQKALVPATILEALIAAEAKIAELEAPGEPELTAELILVENALIRKWLVTVRLSDETKNDKVTGFKIDGIEYGVQQITSDGRVQAAVALDAAPTEVIVIVDGVEVLATINK